MAPRHRPLGRRATPPPSFPAQTHLHAPRCECALQLRALRQHCLVVCGRLFEAVLLDDGALACADGREVGRLLLCQRAPVRAPVAEQGARQRARGKPRHEGKSRHGRESQRVCVCVGESQHEGKSRHGRGSQRVCVWGRGRSMRVNRNARGHHDVRASGS
eukprot:95957-Chlamydomonas_euryale.AAC.2